VTVERRLRACVDRFAGTSGYALSQALGPMLTDAELASMWLQERLIGLQQPRPQLPAGFADPVCQSLVMLDHQRVHLSLAIVSAEGWKAESVTQVGAPQIVGFADGWTTIRFLSAPLAKVQRHYLVRTSQQRRAFAECPRQVTTGEVICLDNAREALRFVGLGADVVMLRLLVRDPDAQQAVECDARTGAVLRIREAQSGDGRTRMMLSLLRSLGRSDAVPAIAEALASWPAHLRWHGVREALATDSIAGFALLQAMAETDPDADLRALARRTRDDLFTRYPQLAA